MIHLVCEYCGSEKGKERTKKIVCDDCMKTGDFCDCGNWVEYFVIFPCPKEKEEAIGYCLECLKKFVEVEDDKGAYSI